MNKDKLDEFLDRYNDQQKDLRAWISEYRAARSEVERLTEVTAQHKPNGRFYHSECGSQYEIKDDKHVWGLAYGEDAAIVFVDALNNRIDVEQLKSQLSSRDSEIAELKSRLLSISINDLPEKDREYEVLKIERDEAVKLLEGMCKYWEWSIGDPATIADSGQGVNYE